MFCNIRQLSHRLFVVMMLPAFLCVVFSSAGPLEARAAEIKEANEALRDKDYPKAIEILDAHLAEHADDPRTLVLRGRAHLGMYAYDKALADLNRAIELQPAKNGRDLASRGRTYLAMREYDKALPDLNQAIELNPRDAELYYDRGTLYAEQEDDEAAFTEFHKALELDPEYVNAYIGRGYSQWRKGIKFKSVEFKQGETVYQGFEFESVVNRELVDQALSDFDRAIERDPNSGYAYQLRSGIYFSLMDWPRYIADMKELVRIFPNDNVVARDLAWLLATIDDDALRDGKLAVELAEKACELSKHENPLELETLAAALAAERKFKRAIEIHEQAIAKLGTASPQVKEACEQRIAQYRQKTPLRLKPSNTSNWQNASPEEIVRPLSARKRKRSVDLTDSEQQLLRSLNVVRKEKGLKALTIHPGLVNMCRDHAREMRKRGEVVDAFDGRQPGDMIRGTGVNPGAWGITSGQAATTGDLLKEWKDSTIAEANLLNAAVNQVGIGTAVNEEGQIYAYAAYVEIR